MTEVYTLDQRREILASMPWVAVSPGPEIFNRRCEGFRSGMPLYVRREDVEIRRVKWGCRNRARWVFLSLDGEIRTYCWWHLFDNGLRGDPEENARYEKWLDQYLKTHPVPPDWTAEEPDEPLGRN